MYVIHENFQSNGNLHLKIFKSLKLSCNRISWKFIFAFGVEISPLQMLSYILFFGGFFWFTTNELFLYQCIVLLIIFFHMVAITKNKYISIPLKFLHILLKYTLNYIYIYMWLFLLYAFHLFSVSYSIRCPEEG